MSPTSLGPPALNPTFRQHKGKERRGRPRKPDGTWVYNLEHTTEQAADLIVKHRHAIANATGDRPYGSRQVSEREQVKRYGFMRDNPEHWAALLEERGQKATIEYALRMEKLAVKYHTEYEYGLAAAHGEQLRQQLEGGQ